MLALFLLLLYHLSARHVSETGRTTMYDDNLTITWFTFIDQKADLEHSANKAHPKLYDVPSLYTTLTWNPSFDMWGNG